MLFENIKVKKLEYAVVHIPELKKWEAKNRKNHIIGVKLTGASFHNFGYQKFNMAENCIFFLNQKDNYFVNVTEKGAALALHFTTYEDIKTDSFCIKLQNISKPRELLEKIQALLSISSGSENLAMSHFYRLCALFEETLAQEYSPADLRISRAAEYIDLHTRDKNCLEDAAKKCNISRRRFNELFRKQYGITPNSYLKNRKITFAEKLLESSTLTISEISDVCGFSDVYYFSKVFKSETGISPGKYRKNNI